MNSKIILFNILFILIIALVLSKSLLGDSTDMRPIYSFKDLKMEIVPRQTYQLPVKQSIEIFPVLVDNAIGTTMDNAISLLRFVDNQVEQEVLKKDFDPYIEGVKYFVKPFSKDYMGSLQSGRILLFNLKDKTHRYFRPLIEPEEHFIEIDVLDGEKMKFLLNIGRYINLDGKRVLDLVQRIYDLSAKPAIELGAYPMGTYPVTNGGSRQEYIMKDLIFMVDVGTKPYQYYALDSDFNRIQHPLLPVVNTHRDLGEECLWEVHPTLPFAVVMGRSKLWVITWRNVKTEVFSIIYRPRYSWGTSFSYDGKWLGIRDIYDDYSNSKFKGQYVVMPIDENLPHYLGNPISLGEIDSEEEFYWTVNPTSIVSYSKPNLIFRWVIPTIDTQKTH